MPKASLRQFRGPKRRLYINLKRISSDTTREYLKVHHIKDEHDLCRLMPACYLEGITKDFHQHSKAFRLPFPIHKVWAAYLNIPPKTCWAGNHIKFSFSYNTSNGEFHYRDDAYRGLEENQLIFIEIALLFGLIKIAVTHQVNQIDRQNKCIKLCYIEGGRAAGSQVLELFSVSDNETEVRHNTHYKSDSTFRDKHLYPPFSWLHYPAVSSKCATLFRNTAVIRARLQAAQLFSFLFASSI